MSRATSVSKARLSKRSNPDYRESKFTQRVCVICSFEFDVVPLGRDADRHTCSRTCGQVLRWRDTPKREPITKTCVFCSSSFICRNAKEYKRRRYCSLGCRAKGTAEEHPEWQMFGGKNGPSFPERYFMVLLESVGLTGQYQYNHHVGRYWIDFAFEDCMLGLEIDGKQHMLPQNVIHDRKRDEFLVTRGWKIHRIPWKAVQVKENDVLMRDEFEAFLAILGEMRCR